MGIWVSQGLLLLLVFCKLSTMNDFDDRETFAKITHKWESLLLLKICSLCAWHTQLFQNGYLWGKIKSCKKNVRKVGSPYQGPRTGQAVKDSHLKDIGCTYSQLLLDHTGRGCNGASCVMLHHLGELCQVSLHEFQGFRGLQKTERNDRASWLHYPVLVPCASLVPERHTENSSDMENLGSKTLFACPNSKT